jgi:zinc-ribbon domain
MRRCRTCGAALEAGANFCGHCGSAITITAPMIPVLSPARAPSSRNTSVVAVPSASPPARRIRPPAPASVSVRYGPTRAQPRRVRPKSRFLAAALEWAFPGLGVMYVGRFWTGALVLLGTFIATGVAVSRAMASSPNAQFEDVLTFLAWLLLAHLVWLLLRMIWAWRLASRATRLYRLYAG